MPRGRVKGSKNKPLKYREQLLSSEGTMPLDYMLAIVRDETADQARRDEMAKACAPYLHPKLSSVESKVEGTMTQKVINAQPMTKEEWVEKYGKPQANGALH